MLIRSLLLTLLFAMVAATGCQGPEEDLISGSWRGAAILEQGKLLDINPADIRLVLDPDGSYHYRSTLNYQEAGTYYVEQTYLYTRDTINQATTEKAVEIVLVSTDSLHLLMNEAGKERLLKLVKE